MAESAVSFVVEKLGHLLIEEAKFLYGVKDQVEWAKQAMTGMQCFLEDADEKGRNGDSRVKNWVREMIQVSYRTEDVIDTFIHQVERRRRQRGFVGCIKRYTLSLAYQMIAAHKVGTEIGSIKSELSRISVCRLEFGIDKLGDTVGNDSEAALIAERRRINPNLCGDMGVIVGLDLHANYLVSQLLDSSVKQKSVLSIVGIGGLGKSTLAKKVYNTLQNNTSFSTLVWATVSENFKPIEVVKEIAGKSMGIPKDELAKMEQDVMETKLSSFLSDRVYLIVLDDVWTSDVWRTINAVLPDGMNGSRVMITTRSEDVAKLAVPNFTPFLLPSLTDDQSWELFTKTIFPASCFPEELIEPGRRMVNKCGGLPLALSVLGGFLSLKPPRPLAWEKVEKSLDWSGRMTNQCMKILALSYKNLPHRHLKVCFLYIASFPEDSTISAREISRLWIAEGFIPQSDKEALEDTVMEYLNEMAQRSMIQVVKRKFDGGVSKFRIHDLLREMCLTEALQDMFLHIVLNSQHNISSSRRLVLHSENGSHSSLPANLRSLFLHGFEAEHGLGGILRGLKFLRVLDLDARYYGDFPMEIKSMSQLRYLKLNCNICELPSAIGNFRSLQTLDLRYCFNFQKLPKELGELPNLKHCLLRRTMHFPAIITSTRLQTLKRISCEQRWLEESLPRLPNLRRLGIDFEEVDGDVMCYSILKLTSLVSLSLRCWGDIPANYMITKLSNNHRLLKLAIDGSWGPQPSLPDSNSFPPNLTKLILIRSGFNKDPIPVLEKLPNLLVLKLIDVHKERDMACGEDGFPRLQEFDIFGLEFLQDWTVAPRAFPNLTKLIVGGCGSLTTLPEGLKHATLLKKLIITGASEEFRDNLLKDVGKDWHHIQHVQSIVILTD